MAEQYKLIYPLQSSQLLPNKNEGKIKKSKAQKSAASVSAAEENGSLVLDEVPESPRNNVQQQKRPLMPVSSNPNVTPRINLIKSYLHETGVAIAMKKLTVELLQNQILPYNPYYGYVKHMRKLAEKFHTKQKTLQELKENVSRSLTFQTSSGILSGVKGNEDNIWGLKHILSSINPKIIKHYSTIILDSHIDDSTLKQVCGKETSILASLYGPFLFTGSVYPNIFQVDVNVNIIISLANEQMVYKLFCQSVLEDIRHVIKHETHCFIKLDMVYKENGVQHRKIWMLENLLQIFDNEGLKSEFEKTMIQGLHNKAIFESLNAIKTNVPVSKTSGMIPYLPMKKTYHLTSDLITAIDKKDFVRYVGMSSSLLPYQDLHEGIYFDRSKVESYLSLLKKQTSAKSPFHSPVMSNMKTKWKGIISKIFLQEQFLEIGHLIYLLDKVQNISKTSSALVESDLAIQFARVCNGSAFKLLSLSPLNHTLFSIAQLKENCPDKMSTAFNSILQTYMSFLKDRFYLHDFSSDLTCGLKTITELLEEIKSSKGTKQHKKLEDAIIFLDNYTNSMSVILLNDAIEPNSILNSIKTRINEEMGTLFPTPELLGIEINPNSFVHNLRNTFFLNVDTISLDLNKCMSSGTAPKNIAMETVMMQYCADMHIDNIWEEYLNNLFFDKNHFPPNPFPQLVTLLRKGALKVQLFRESDLNITKRFLQNKIKLADTSQQIFTVSGLQAFGLLSSIKIINLNGYRQIQSIAENLATFKNEDGEKETAPMRMEKFEIKCLSALSSETMFYGSATPYLCSFSFNEHCYIRGPNHSEHSGITMLAKVLVKTIKRIIVEESVLPCEAIFGEHKLDISDFNNLESRFIDDFVNHVNDSHRCQIILLIKFDWKYVQIKKEYFVYYINENTERMATLVELNDISKSFQIFFNLHDAIYHYKRNKINMNKRALETHANTAMKSKEWSEFARLISDIALHSYETVNKLSEVDHALLAFTWKYFHSLAGAVHYNQSLAQSLRYALVHLSYDSNKVFPIIEKMMIGFKHHLSIVLNSKSAMIPTVLNVMLHRRLNKFCKVDLANQSLQIFDAAELSNELNAISNLLKHLQDSTVYDLIKISNKMSSMKFIE